MLSSDNDGEVIAAAKAIGRVLKSEGLDWHWFAEQIRLPKKKATQPNYIYPWSRSRSKAQETTVLEVVTMLLENSHLLTVKQLKFVTSMRTMNWEDMTAKQRACLNGLVVIINRELSR